MSKIPSQKQGFTLIELSIVLVIIALLIGGVMAGQALIRNSQLRTVGTEAARYTQAIISFRDKYQALPGDFAGATALWGTLGAGTQGCSGSATSPVPLTVTCDGNGDGRITIQAFPNTTANAYEEFRAWQHLANAGFIDGSYSGAAGATDPTQATIGTNVPASKLSGAGYALISLLSGEIPGSPYKHYFTGINYMHMLQFGAPASVAGNYSTIGPILTTAEAMSLDQKLDDGYPGSGNIMAPGSDSAYAPNCTTATIANASTAAYAVTTQSGNKCSLLFLLGF